MGLMTPGRRENGEEDRREYTEAETCTHRGVWALMMVVSDTCCRVMTVTMRWISGLRERGIGAQLRGIECASVDGWGWCHMRGGERTCWVRGRPAEIKH